MNFFDLTLHVHPFLSLLTNRWIISKLNLSLKGQESYHFIGVLDIFGFENFEVQNQFFSDL